MSRYISRLAQRSSILGKASSGRQSVTTPASGGIVEAHQQSEAQTTTMASSSTDTASAREKGGSSSVIISKPEYLATPAIPSQAGNVKSVSPPNSSTRIEKQSVKRFVQESERPNQGGTDKVRQSVPEPFNEHTRAVKNGAQDIKPPRMDSPNASSAGLTQDLISWGQEKLLVESSPGLPAQNTVAEATSLPTSGPVLSASWARAVSEPTVSMLKSYHDDHRVLADAYPGISDAPMASIPRTAPRGNKRQDIEIHIGSLSMEVYEKHSAIASSLLQSEAKTDSNKPRSAESSSGFRPSRYYLRGV